MVLAPGPRKKTRFRGARDDPRLPPPADRRRGRHEGGPPRDSASARIRRLHLSAAAGGVPWVATYSPAPTWKHPRHEPCVSPFPAAPRRAPASRRVSSRLWCSLARQASALAGADGRPGAPGLLEPRPRIRQRAALGLERPAHRGAGPRHAPRPGRPEGDAGLRPPPARPDDARTSPRSGSASGRRPSTRPRKLDMNIWIYDENSYPSGFAGGLRPRRDARVARPRVCPSRRPRRLRPAATDARRLPPDGRRVRGRRPRTRGPGSRSPRGRYLVARIALRRRRRRGTAASGTSTCCSPASPRSSSRSRWAPTSARSATSSGSASRGSSRTSRTCVPAGGLPWTDDLPRALREALGLRPRRELPEPRPARGRLEEGAARLLPAPPRALHRALGASRTTSACEKARARVHRATTGSTSGRGAPSCRTTWPCTRGTSAPRSTS